MFFAEFIRLLSFMIWELYSLAILFLLFNNCCCALFVHSAWPTNINQLPSEFCSAGVRSSQSNIPMINADEEYIGAEIFGTSFMLSPINNIKKNKKKHKKVLIFFSKSRIILYV